MATGTMATGTMAMATMEMGIVETVTTVTTGNGHNSHSNPLSGDRRRGLMPITLDANGVELPPSEIPVQRLEALLAKPMPWWKRRSTWPAPASR